MSSLIVRVCAIDRVDPHSNADALEIVVIGGWQCAVRKGQYRAGDLAVYIPPDTALPQTLTDELGVTRYCTPVPGSASYQRVRCARLRGEPSFGLVIGRGDIASSEDEWVLGSDWANRLHAWKYEPPVSVTAGDAAAEHWLFPRYTEIENLRHYPTIFNRGGWVAVTEKIHGANCRVGIVDGVRVAGSRNIRRQEPALHATSMYWYPWSVAPVETMLLHLSSAVDTRQVVLYGEVFGRGVQALDYGEQGLAFLAFDLLVDGHYWGLERMHDICDEYGVSYVPVLLRMAWDADSLQRVVLAASGKAFAGNHEREGVVVRTEQEARDPYVGRLVFKYLSDDYLLARRTERADH